MKAPSASQMGGSVEPLVGCHLREGARTGTPRPGQRVEGGTGTGHEVHHEDHGGEGGGLVTEEPEHIAPLPVSDRGDIDAELEGEVEESPVRGGQCVGRPGGATGGAGPAPLGLPRRDGQRAQAVLFRAHHVDQLDQFEMLRTGRPRSTPPPPPRRGPGTTTGATRANSP